MTNISEETDIFEEVKNNPKTGIGRHYSLEDIRTVWEALSQWILDQLKTNKSVKISQLGTFTLSQWSLETGIRRELRVSRPIFLMSKTLMNDFDFHQPKQYADDKVPLTVINHFDLSRTTRYQPDAIKSCIDEVVQCVRRVSAMRRDFRLGLTGLGTLRVVRTRVDFQFDSGQVSSRKFNFDEPTCYRAAASLTPYKPARGYCPVHSN